MGKVKKFQKYGENVSKPQPLSEQIISENQATPSFRVKHKKEDDDDKFVDGTLGRNILQQSFAQLQELDKEEEEKEKEEEEKEEEFPPLRKAIKRKRNRDVDVSLVKQGVKKAFRKGREHNNDCEDSDSDSDAESVNAKPINVDEAVKNFEEQLNLDNEDLEALDHFKNKDSSRQIRLADLFRDKITEKQTEIQSIVDNSSVKESTLKPETVVQCQEIGDVLHKYRSGPLPKMLKTFPVMSCWEELLLHTDPEKWTAAAMYQVTRLFVSNLQAHMAQHFCSFVLLPRIRDDISYYKKLNFHLYQALSKALYKPAAFFKGIVFPLCSNGDCSLREAIIIGSLLANTHVPIAHSAAAILKIISMPYHGANFIFLRVLFDKKYALPYKVIEETVNNFKRFRTEEKELTVLWHQTLLSFIQRYKNDLTAEQKKEIFHLTTYHSHYKITPHIRKELEESSNVECMDVN